MSRIFLSHSSANNGPAVALRDWLKAEGWDDVFLDLDPERGIRPGERWEKALNQAAYRCEAVLFVVSKAWCASEWCKKEVELAARLNKRMFGVLIEDLAVSEVPSELTRTWQLVNLVQGTDQEPFEATTPDGKVHYGLFSRGGLRRLKEGLVRAGLDPRFFDWPPANDPTRAPYRGLPPMEAEDAGIFYGREAPIIETLDKLRGLRQAATSRLLVILGASGSGKSSFLRAGIMPRLARDDRNFLMLPVVRPERAVISGETGLMRSVEKACAAVGFVQNRAEIKKALATGAKGVLTLLAGLASKATPPRHDGEAAPKPPSVVLAIDQGEELFQAEGAEESQAFNMLLKDLLVDEDSNLIVLFTIRSDAYAALQAETLLKDIHQQPLNLPPVPRGAYQTIIEGPALRLKDTKRPLKIEPQLTDALLKDIEEGGAKDALPLLAFTLERLYIEHGADGDLKLAEYQEIGGIKGSIDAAVEQALKTADGDPTVPRDRATRLALLRRAFIPWLAGIDPDTGSPRRSIARMSDIPEESRSLVKHLIAQRLLATDRSASGEKTIEPAHEALLRQWGLLEGWLDEDFAELAALEGVKRATRDWLANDRSPDWLAHAAGRLEDAERLKARPDLAAKMAPDDLDYLIQCRVAETDWKDKELNQAKKLAEAQTRIASRTRLGLIAAVLLAVVAAGFAYYGLTQAEKAEEQATIAVQKSEEAAKERQQAVYNEGVALSGLSQVALSEGYPVRAMKLALAAWPRQGSDGRPKLKRSIESLSAAGLQSFQRLLLKGHNSAVASARFSPDGTRVVTASSDTTARVWDAKTGAVIAILKGHEGPVNYATFSPDGTSVVTASDDKTARIWDAKTGAWRATLKGHLDNVIFAIFSFDGTRVATGSTDQTARLWDAKSGAEIEILRGDESEVIFATFSPDGKRVVTISAFATAHLWDATRGLEIAVLEGNKSKWDRIFSAAFSADGKRVETRSLDGTARVWDAETGTEIAVLEGQVSGSADGPRAFSLDGTRAVTRYSGNTVVLWNAETGDAIADLKGHEKGVLSVAFSPDGKRVVTASEDTTARLWDASAEAGIILQGDEAEVSSAGLSPDGTLVVTASRDKIARVWDTRKGGVIAVLKGHEGPVNSAAFSPDGTRVVTGSSDTTVRLWDAKTGSEIAVFRGHKRGVNSVTFSLDGTRVVTASGDETARVWEARTGVVIAVLKGHEGPVNSATFSPDGTRVLTASDDKTARLWDAQTGTEIARLKGHNGEIASASFSLDGTRVVTASFDKTARLWDGKTGAEIIVLTRNEWPLTSAAFSPDGMRLVTASLDAQLWDIKSGTEIAVLKGRNGYFNFAAFSTDGTRVVTASSDKTARVWDISALEKGDAFSVACQRLGNDTDLTDVRERYGLGEIVPICGKNAPLPADLTELQ